jgi:4-aminobutyrate aminotransferase-like enzyme
VRERRAQESAILNDGSNQERYYLQACILLTILHTINNLAHNGSVHVILSTASGRHNDEHTRKGAVKFKRSQGTDYQPYLRNMARQKGWSPLHIVGANGCYFTDSDGKKYLDFSGQLMCLPLGHQNPAVIQAIVDQAQELAYISPGYTTSVRASLSKLLLEVLPKGLNKFFFTTSGTDANEAAFKIARMATGKSKIISRYRSYHGSTAGSIAATGDPRRWRWNPPEKCRMLFLRRK